MSQTHQNQSQLYLRILDQFPNPIWRAGINGKCDYFNPAWLEFTGRTIDQEVGDGWAEGVHKEDFDQCLKNISIILKPKNISLWNTDSSITTIPITGY